MFIATDRAMCSSSVGAKCAGTLVRESTSDYPAHSAPTELERLGNTSTINITSLRDFE